MGIVALQGIQLFANHGVHASEKLHGNHFVVDVEVETQVAHGAFNDDISQAVNYEEIYALVKRCFEERVHLLETLVQRIGEEMVRRFARVERIRVKVSKLTPPLGGEVSSAFVMEDFFP